MREFILVVPGISGVPLAGGLSPVVPVRWQRYLIDAIMLFAQSADSADTAGLSLSITDENNRAVFADGDGDPFAPALALVGRGPSLFFPDGPRWFRTRRVVSPQDTWNVQVEGGVGVVPILGFHCVEIPREVAA